MLSYDAVSIHNGNRLDNEAGILFPTDCPGLERYQIIADLGYVPTSATSTDPLPMIDEVKLAADESQALTQLKAAAWDRLMASQDSSTNDALLEAWQWYMRATEKV